MKKILICDPLHQAGLDLLDESGVEYRLLEDGERAELPSILGDYDAMIVRSMTKVTAELLEAGKTAGEQRLKVVGRAGIGVDNVDVAAATEHGILVVNAPTANLISATEHTFALMLAVARNVPSADASLKSGEWNRKQFLGTELHGKTLGIIGLGRIGQNVAVRAQSFEMRTIAYDPFLDPAVAKRLDIEACELDDLLANADVVTLHVPLTDQTRNLIDRERIAKMKPGALIVNCARGGTLDEAALIEALNSGHIAAAGLDVFTTEPPADFEPLKHPRLVTTPHIGAQTREAQERVATETVKMLLAALDGSLTVTAVNLPFRTTGSRGEPYLKLGEQLGLLASSTLGGSYDKLQIDFWGIDEDLQASVSVAAVKGVLAPFLGETVNYVNAEHLAESRGIEVVRASHQGAGDYPHLIGISLAGGGRSIELAGTLFGERDPRVVRFAGYQLEFRPQGKLLVLKNADVPGVVGKIGQALGEGGVNIADIHLARGEDGEDALAVLRLDEEPVAEVLGRLAALPEVSRALVVNLERI